MDRLVRCDPEHFEWQTGLGGSSGFVVSDDRGGCYSTIVYGGISWNIAGFCLEQMQARWRGAPKHAERRSLSNVFDGLALFDLTPETIIETYCEWKEAVQG